MAGASKRTSVILAVVAVIFIIVIIILCVIPEPCRPLDERPHCKKQYYGSKHWVADGPPPKLTTVQLTSPSTTSTASTESPEKIETLPSTVLPTTLLLTKSTTNMISSSTSSMASTNEVSVTDWEETTKASTAATTTEYTPDYTSENATALTSKSTVVFTTEIKTGNATEEATEGTTEAATEVTTEGAIEATTENTTLEAIEATTEEATDATTKDTIEGANDATTEEATDVTTEDAIEEVTDATTENTTEKATDATAEEATETTTEVTTEEATDATTEDTIEEASDTTTEEASDATTEAVSDATTEDAIEGVTDATTENTTENTTEKATDATIEDTTEEATDATDEEATDAKTEEAIDTTTEVTAEEATDVITKDTTEHTTEDTTEDATDVTTDTYPTTPSPDVYEVCDTEGSRKVASRMLSTMDHGIVDPCEDFYTYSCGGILDENFIKPENAQLPADDFIKEALKRPDRDDENLKELLVVYDSCLNYSNSHSEEDRLRDAREVFINLGYNFNPKTAGQFKADYDSYVDNFDLSDALGKMMKMHFTPFFDILIDPSDNDPSAFTLKMTLPVFKSPFSNDRPQSICLNEYLKEAEKAKFSGEIFDVDSFYVDYVNCTRLGEGWRGRIEKMAESVFKLEVTEHVKNKSANEEMIYGTRTLLDYMILDISKNLPSPPEIRRTLLGKNYKLYRLSELDDGTVFQNSPFDFATIIRILLGTKPNMHNTYIQVYFEDVFQEIFDVISMEAPHDMQNIVLMLWAEHLYDDLVSPVGPAPGSEDYCFKAITHLMDDYTSYLYLKKLPERNKLQNKLEAMIGWHTKEATDQLTSTPDATDDFKDKLDELKGIVPNLEEMTQALQNTAKMEVTENNFVKNYASLVAHYRKRLYDLYRDGNPTDPSTLWSFLQFPYKTSGVSSYSLNRFLIPIAAMAPPFYHGEEVPDYINFAGIGHMIAHELMHGFDNTGMKYKVEHKADMNANPALLAQTDCLAEELQRDFPVNSKSGVNSTFTLDKDLSLNELLADSAATKLAWDTFLSNRTVAEIVEDPGRASSRRRRRDVAKINHKIGGLRNRVKRKQPAHSHSPTPTASPHCWPPSGYVLPYFPSEFTPQRLFYLKTAQNQCSASSEVYGIDVKENEHLPAKLRVNLVLRNDPLFAKAFNCKPGSYMRAVEQCQFTPMGN